MSVFPVLIKGLSGLSDRQKILTSTMMLLHLFAFLLAPWLHVHPGEDHGHVEGKVGHAHLSTGKWEADHHHHEAQDHQGVLEFLHDHGHSAEPLPVTALVYKVVSKFRFNVSFQANTFAYSASIIPHFSSPILSQFEFLPEGDVPLLILSNRILSVTDLPPPIV